MADDAAVERAWQGEQQQWSWYQPADVPLIADLDGDGRDSRLAYRSTTGEWFVYPGPAREGPSMPHDQLPLPLVGRFVRGSAGDWGVWSRRTGTFTLRALDGEAGPTVAWGESVGGVLVPGDYDGDGYDEIAVWRRPDSTWYVQEVPGGAVWRSRFGSATAVPLPADYDHDGRLDLAYWEPSAHKIHVSFDHGRSVGLEIRVPMHSIPAFVNMY